MSIEEFERYKEALKVQKLEKPKRLSELYSKFINEIALQQYHFDRSEKEVEILNTITKEQVLEYYKLFIAPDSPSRQALSIYVVASPENIEESETDETTEVKCTKPITSISDLTAFKCTKPLYPMAKPHITIYPKGARSKL